MGAAVNPWVLRKPAARPDALRLLCLPHAGSGAAWYGTWSSRLGADVDVVPVQPPGRENRLAEAPHVDMRSLVDAMGPALSPWCTGRYALFGHSMGSHVVFELVQWLRDSGLELPVCLIVSGSRAPHLPPVPPLLCEMNDDELLGAIESRYGSRFEPDMRELVQLTLPTLRADLSVVETHVHRATAPLPVPLLVLAGAGDDSVPLADARQWERHTSESFEFKLFPGGHYFPMTQRDAVLACLTRVLAQHSAAAA